MRASVLALAAAMVCGSAANAGVYSDDMSKCLVKHTSPDDQIVFVQWIFSALALHPNVKGLANITDQQRETFNTKAGALFVRLMTKDCRPETLAALKYEGNLAIEVAFGQFGEAATRQLMTDPTVQKGLEGLVAAFENKDLKDLLKESGLGTNESK